MRGEEKGRAVEFGKGVGGFDDGVAEAFQNALVERVEDGVLENDVLDVVFLACILISRLACRGGGGAIDQSIPSISSMEIKAASS